MSKRLRQSIRVCLALWIIITTIRIAALVALEWFKAEGKTSITHLPLVFLLWPEAAIVPAGITGVPIDFPIALALALCIGSAGYAAIMTCIRAGIVWALKRIENGGWGERGRP